MKKTFKVNFDMAWSQDIVVKASTLGEAKKLAFEKLKKKLSIKMFNTSAEREDI